MMIQRFLIVLAVTGLAAPLFVRAETPHIVFENERVHPTRLIARFADAGNPANRAAWLGVLGEEIIARNPIVPGLVVLKPAITGTAQAAVANPEAALRTRLAALQATGWFEYVEPDRLVRGSIAPTDAAFVDGTLWGLRNSGQNGGVAGADINVTNAWDLTTGSTDVIVAVIDSGIRHTHQDLAAQMWVNPGEIPGNGIDDDGDGYVDNVHGINAINGSGNSMDNNDHGTHVAGIIGAAANDGNPHVGVAWQVRLMACKFLDANLNGLVSDAIECIGFAVANGARVLNNSWEIEGSSQGLADAIAAARDQGVLFVAAAGNDENDNDASPVYPASYPLSNVISVTGLNRVDHRAGSANFGRNTVHLGAPGAEVFSCTRGADDEYKILGGTSAAAPHVSGVAALILARYPGISLTELRLRILQTVAPIPALHGITATGGRLNAYGALSVSQDGVLEVTAFTPLGFALPAGETVPVYVRLTDLTDVTNATVTGSTASVPDIGFVNTGVAPDQTAGDAVYSANLAVPTTGGQLALTLVVSAPGKQTRTNVVDFSIVSVAPNDAFANRVSLSGLNHIIHSSNVGASREAGEPLHCGDPGGASVWWTWTATASGTVYVSTSGSSFDTIVAVYTGTQLATLSGVACNDERDFEGARISEVSFPAVAGTTYQIAVDGWFDGFLPATGSIVLSILAPPANDSFANRAILSGAFAEAEGYNIGASRETGEPAHCAVGGEQSVWWTWTAPASGNVAVNTAGSTFDTVVGVYSGSALNALTSVTCNDDENYPSVLTSKATFAASAGSTYHFAVDGLQLDAASNFSTEAGLISLVLSVDGKSRLSELTQREDDDYQFVLKGDSGRTYRIQASEDLEVWTDVGVVSLNGVTGVFADTAEPTPSLRFYRALPQ